MTLTNLLSVSDSAPPHCLYFEQGTALLSTCEDTGVFVTKGPRPGASQPLSTSECIVTSLSFFQTNTSFINNYSQPSRDMRHSQMLLDILSQPPGWG